MKLFAKKLFASLFLFTALIGAGRIKGMDQGTQTESGITTLAEKSAPDQRFNPLLAQLKTLCNECVISTSIRNAFNETFGLICTMVVQQNNPQESIQQLEWQSLKAEIDLLIKPVQNQLNHDYMVASSAEFQARLMNHQPSQSLAVSMSHYQILLLQMLDDEAERLHKKITVLIFLLNDVITSGQRPAYLDDAKLLKNFVEYQVDWAVWLAMKETGQAAWRYVSGRCVIL